MQAHGDIESYTGGGGYTADGLVRKCSMLRVKPGGDIEGYKEWHRKVWPEMQAHIRRSGTTNYSIFSRPDGVLFLYQEQREELAAAAAAAGDDGVVERWQKLMDPFLDRDWKWNGPLKHVMYMDPDPATRSMTCVDLPQLPPPRLAPNPSWGGYDTYTGGGGWSLSGRRRQASQLKCREDGACQAPSTVLVAALLSHRTPVSLTRLYLAGITEYNRWHAQVWPELQVLGFRGGSRNYSIFQRADGLLFLYSEVDEVQAARDRQSPPPPPNDVNDRWQAMMNTVGLVRDYPHNGSLEHVMYIGDDRTMEKPY